MKDVSLKDLLEAGCHFGHKVERWHPKAAEFIFGEREGIHIIDLVKTRDGLKNAGEYLKNLGQTGKVVLFVATKRQSKGIVSDAAKRAVVFYLTNRWIGGFLTNWEEVKKNIDKANRMRKELDGGIWKKFPKHEQVKLEKDLRKLESVYTGVKELTRVPEAIFIIDIKREISSLREAVKCKIPIVAIIDTNTNPNNVDYPIPANDDAVGSIQFIVNYLADAYLEGKKLGEKKEDTSEPKEKELPKKTEEKIEAKKEEKPQKKSKPKKLK
ncbi:30S ribosomal protein S2 [Candidatus Gottesmanbacteria bacterium]|nr:30S ribosomal protein S2 [Candidatus Gottesmanbacteria bacterium]